MAKSQYFLGNFGRVLEFVGLARSAGNKSGLTLAQFRAGALTAELLICGEQGRLGEADALAPLVALGTNSEWEPFSLHSRAAISIISKKSVERLDLLRLCRQSYSTWSPPGSIIVISEGLRATVQDCDALRDAHSSRTLIDVMLITPAATHPLSSFAISGLLFKRALRRPQSRKTREFFEKVHDSRQIVDGVDGALLSERERERARIHPKSRRFRNRRIVLHLGQHRENQGQEFLPQAGGALTRGRHHTGEIPGLQ